jgi:hypothetical protein
MGTYWIRVGTLCLLIALTGCVTSGGYTAKSKGPQQLDLVRSAMQGALDTMDRDAAKAAKSIVATGLTGPEARKVLLDLCRAHPYVVDCCTIDAKGVMTAVEPKKYEKSEGVDISVQEQVARMLDKHEPVLSAAFVAVEGMPAIDLEWPVLAVDGAFLGSVSMMFKPDHFIAPVIQSAMTDPAWTCWVMQPNGLILYDQDTVEINRNIFSNQLYDPFPDLRDMAKRIAANPSGAGKYRFLSKNLDLPTNKRCHWDTVRLHGTEWRVVVTREIR